MWCVCGGLVRRVRLLVVLFQRTVRLASEVRAAGHGAPRGDANRGPAARSAPPHTPIPPRPRDGPLTGTHNE